MSDLTIHMRAKASPAGSYDVEAKGEFSRPATDADRALFGISDGSVKAAIAAIWNRSPNDVFFSDPTHWPDETFAHYSWPPLQLTLKPANQRLVRSDISEVSVSTRLIKNEFDKKISVNARLDTAMEDSVATTWSKTSTLAISPSISVGYKLFGAELSASYTQGWQQDSSETSSVTIGSGVDIAVDLDPKESIKVTNMANLGTATIEVDFDAYLTGGFFINYNPPYQLPGADSAHHFFFMDVNPVLTKLKVELKKTITLQIAVSAYQYIETTAQRLAGEGAALPADEDQPRILHANPSFRATAKAA